MATQTKQIQWGFSEMQIGDRRTIPARFSSRARAAARNCTVNNFGQFLFEFEKDRATGDVLITRVAQRKDPNAWMATRKDDPIYMLLVGE